jgi:anhydro-N-acetylmuramic acid kinase
VLAHAHADLPPLLARELLALNASGADELHRAALATHGLMDVYAEVVQRLLRDSGRQARDVLAIGAHGQTVRHRPQAFAGTGYTLQLANGAMLAERCGITTVCDFRSADVAAGGQGAPLVPAFHAACFRRRGTDVAVLNVGGIANLTLLPASGAVSGFDTGPGNVLMDLWCHRCTGQPFDRDGAMAAAGRVLPQLLAALRAEPYFEQPPPKSSGRDLFHADWLQERLQRSGCDAAAPADVMATLAELTAGSVVDALRQHLPGTERLLVCGGGARNRHLMARWQALLPTLGVVTTSADGVPPDQVEALAFAWLAACRLMGRPASLPEVTGARAPRVLGAVYPAPP